MPRKETRVQKITRLTLRRFPSLSVDGINAREIVSFILAKRNSIERSELSKIGDDARDYVNTSYFLKPLSDKAIMEIGNLGRNEIRRRLREKIYPFSRLNKKTRETLIHLPNSWVHGAAAWLLNARMLKRAGPQIRILAD